ncbi:hypothetical protein B0H94_105247 [Salsuginibacillus halophilus]|uniref:Methyl-accepting chemotaxis protein n=1 Tax=Salsuginibacillus halophilus TaxID=517424 RepID=A0A2P8HLL1_9BACI|nr:hypothetical protein [Salsuginibacillus halophilus]PSL47091.1 hypothetical protein B0H94_105247 [Salsuginibacillus halophilus]
MTNETPNVLEEAKSSFETLLRDIEDLNQTGEHPLQPLLNEVEETIVHPLKNMMDEEALRQTLDRFLSDTSEEDQTIDALKTIIQTIRKYIIDIEMVSINAMIHSRRLGGNGKAFGVISQNIKEFSNEMKKQYNQAYEHVERLHEWNDRFTEKINGLLNYSKELRTIKMQEFNQIVTDIKQSLPSGQSAVTAERMDELKTLSKGLTAGEETAFIEKAEQTLNDLTVENGEALSEHVLEKIQSLQHELANFSTELETLLAETDNFSEQKETFKQEMRGVEQQFSAIKEKMDYLKRLNVMSRIEISRLDREMQSFGDEIDQISQQVVREVETSDTFIVELQAKLNEDLEHFFKQLDGNTKHLKEAQATAHTFSEQLDPSQGVRSDSMHGLPSFHEASALIEEAKNMYAHS